MIIFRQAAESAGSAALSSKKPHSYGFAIEN